MIKYLAAIFIFLLAGENVFSQKKSSPLSGKIICVDAGHGGTASTDHYRVGPDGEREEWINLRVANFCRKSLKKKGQKY